MEKGRRGNKKETLIRWILKISILAIVFMGVYMAANTGIFVLIRTNQDYTEIASTTSVHVANMIDTLSNGEYSYDDATGIFKKGTVVITGDALFAARDYNPNVYHTIFWGKKRIISDITDDKGESVVGTELNNQEIIDAVAKDGIYNDTSVDIYGSKYSVCYYPLKNGDEIVGYVFTGVDRKEATGHIYQDVVLTVIITLIIALVIGITSTFVVRKRGQGFSDNLVTVVETIADKRSSVEEKGHDTNENMEQINVAISQMSQAVTEQATHSEEIMGTMDDFGTSIDSIMNQVENTSRIADDSTKLIEELSAELEALEAASIENSNEIENIAEQIDQDSLEVENIKQIVSIIDDIALQIRILSFNASVEAARAGEAGLGFAVVAGSVKELSDKTQESINEITEIIGSINEKMSMTSQSSQELKAKNERLIEALAGTKNRMGSVTEAFDRISENIARAQSESEAILEAKNQVVGRVASLAAVSQENAAMSEEIASTANVVIERTEDLLKEIEGLQTITDIVDQTKNDFM